MGQKNNPILLRLASSTKNFDNSWYSDKYYTKLLSIDLSLYKYINNFLRFLKLPSARFSIQHLQRSTKLYLFFCYPQKSRELKSKIFQVPTGLPSIRKQKMSENLFYNLSQFKTINLSEKNSIQQYFTTSFLTKKLNSFYKKKVLSYYLKSFESKLFKTNLQINENSKLINSINALNPLKLNLKKRPFSKNALTKISINPKKNLFNSLILMKQVEKNKFNYLTYKDFQIKFFLSQLFSLTKFLNSQKILCDIVDKKSIKPNKSLLTLVNILYSNQFQEKTKIQFNNLNTKYKNYLENFLSDYYNLNFQLIPFKVNNEWQSANYFADEIVYLLERRVSFKRLKTILLKQVTQNSKIRGIRILCSGRVGGKSKKAQRAKTESFKYGQTSLHVFSSKIDFSTKTAFTPLGSTGVKVWICYN